MSLRSKCLYNAALFRLRQVFTGWDKEERTDNEKEVFREIRVMQAVYPHVKAGCVLSYRALYACSRGYAINADCSGAANILRKAFPDAWQGTDDFRFLSYPETIGFRSLDRGRTA